MGKISPVSIKYMIYASFSAEGALEKPDVIGAIFGQTEGLLGRDLEMRELQKEGKIGRIEVDLQREGKRTTGTVKIPTALDRSETTLIAAAVETIERIGPSDSQIEIDKIEDVRGSKRDYILDRAKKLMKEFQGATSSREISNEIRDSARMSEVSEYGNEKLPCGDISGKEIIVVEGRADVLNLMRNGVNNVIAMSGTKLPEGIKELSHEKDITLFVDGDRGGKLIIQNVVDNTRIKDIVIAPAGKEVEELSGKEILMALRKRIPVEEFFTKKGHEDVSSSFNNHEIDKEKLKEISKRNEGSGKAIILDSSLNEIKKVAARAVSVSLKKSERNNPAVVVVDGTVTSSIIRSAEEAKLRVIVGKNFATTDTRIELMSF